MGVVYIVQRVVGGAESLVDVFTTWPKRKLKSQTKTNAALYWEGGKKAFSGTPCPPTKNRLLPGDVTRAGRSLWCEERGVQCLVAYFRRLVLSRILCSSADWPEALARFLLPMYDSGSPDRILPSSDCSRKGPTSFLFSLSTPLVFCLFGSIRLSLSLFFACVVVFFFRRCCCGGFLHVGDSGWCKLKIRRIGSALHDWTVRGVTAWMSVVYSWKHFSFLKIHNKVNNNNNKHVEDGMVWGFVSKRESYSDVLGDNGKRGSKEKWRGEVAHKRNS